MESISLAKKTLKPLLYPKTHYSTCALFGVGNTDSNSVKNLLRSVNLNSGDPLDIILQKKQYI